MRDRFKVWIAAASMVAISIATIYGCVRQARAGIVMQTVPFWTQQTGAAPEPDLLAWTYDPSIRFDFNGDQTNNTCIIDLSGNFHNASNAPTWGSGPLLSILSTNEDDVLKWQWITDGSDDHWVIPSHDDLSLIDETGTNDCAWAFAAWVRVNQDVPNDTFFCKGNGEGSYEYRIGIDGAGNLEFYQFSRGGSASTLRTYAGGFTSNSWTFFVLAFDPKTTNATYFYGYDYSDPYPPGVTSSLPRLIASNLCTKSVNYISMSNCNANAYMGTRWAGGSTYALASQWNFVLLKKGTNPTLDEVTALWTNTLPSNYVLPTPFQYQYWTAPWTPQLRLEWHTNATSEWVDLSPFGNNATNIPAGAGGPTVRDLDTNIYARVRHVLAFNGTNQYLEIGDSESLSFGNGYTDVSFSVWCWGRFAGSSLYGVVSKMGNGVNYEWFTSIAAAGQGMTLYSRGSTAASARRYVSRAHTLDTNKWYFFGWAYDPSSVSTNGMRLYIGNSNTAPVQVSGAWTDGGSYVAMTNTSAPAWIGHITPAASLFFNGDLISVEVVQSNWHTADFVLAWSNSIPGSNYMREVTALDNPYWKSPWDAYSVLRIDFDATNTTQVLDYSGYGNHASNNPSGAGAERLIVSTNVRGRVKHAYNLNGVDNFFSVIDADELSFGDGATDVPFTFIAWCSRGQANDVLLAKMTNPTQGPREYWWEYDGGLRGLYLYDDATAKYKAEYRAWALPAVTVVFAAVTYNPSGPVATNLIRQYLGYSDTAPVLSEGATVTNGFYAAMTNTSRPLLIGTLYPTTYNFTSNIYFIEILRGTNLTLDELTTYWQYTNPTNYMREQRSP